MKIKSLTLLVLVVTFLGSCVTPKDKNLLQDIPKNYRPGEKLNYDYRIIPGDQLRLKLYTLDQDIAKLYPMFITNSSESSRVNIGGGQQSQGQREVLNVYSDGTVKIPYIGRVNVQDMSLLEAKKVIEAKFQEFSPSITINLILQNRYFSMLGAIGEKRIPMPASRINIFQALALGGNIQDFGDRRKVNDLYGKHPMDQK